MSIDVVYMYESIDCLENDIWTGTIKHNRSGCMALNVIMKVLNISEHVIP